MADPPDPQQRPLLNPRPADFASDNLALSPSSSSSTVASSTTSSSTSALSSCTADTVLALGDGADGDSFSVCPMKTVPVSSLLMPSPCFLVALLLLPPVLGFFLYLFVEFFVPVLVQILMDM